MICLQLREGQGSRSNAHALPLQGGGLAQGMDWA